MARNYLCGIAFLLSTLALSGQQGRSLGEIARQLKAQKNGSQPAAARPAAPSAPAIPAQSQMQSAAPVTATGTATAGSSQDNNGEAQRYAAGILQLFQQENFQELDRLATEARTAKARFTGGAWKLRTIYLMMDLPAQGENAPESEWAQHLDRLERWRQQFPNSVTARIALAHAYDSYGWKARGHGFGDQVTEDGWRLLAERAHKARQMLEEAEKLPEKCPEWFLAMMAVARSEGWEPDQINALFLKAIAFEPDYHYYYEVQAESLLPKWGGEEGDATRFAEWAANRMGGKKGDILYFRIAAKLICACDNEQGLNGLSWPRIKSGYSALQELYGSSILQMNSMALMAYRAADYDYSSSLFDQIADRWEKSVWLSSQRFYSVKYLATIPRIKPALAQAQENAKMPDGESFNASVTTALEKNYHQVLLDCLKTSPEFKEQSMGLLMQVAKDGSVRDVLFMPYAPVTCFRPQIQKAMLPMPPRADYWVLVKMKAQ
jgi:hypothetical protein